MNQGRLIQMRGGWIILETNDDMDFFGCQPYDDGSLTMLIGAELKQAGV